MATLSQSELREEVWGSTGTDSSDFSSTLVDRFLNLSWHEVQDKLDYREEEGLATFTCVSGQADYPISGFITDFSSVQSVFVQSTTETTWSRLTYKDYNTYLEEQDDNAASNGLPENFTRYGTSVLLQPTPDAAYPVKVRYIKTLADLISSGFPIPQQWSEIILQGAIARIWQRIGDPNRMATAFQMRDALILNISTTKIQENVSNMAGISILRAPYP
jgi:hypothetical protein